MPRNINERIRRWGRRPIVGSSCSFLLILGLAVIGITITNALDKYGIPVTWTTQVLLKPVEVAFGIAIAVFLALMHDEHLREFRELEERIQLNSRIEDRIKKLLPGYHIHSSAYDIVIPTERLKRPMAFVAPGDLFVLHVLESAMEMVTGAPKQGRGLTLRHVEKKLPYWEEQTRSRMENDFARNCIFLCNPLANPAAYALMPSVRVGRGGIPIGEEASENIARLRDRVNPQRDKSDQTSELPVWFGHTLDALNGREELHQLTDRERKDDPSLSSGGWHQKVVTRFQDEAIYYSQNAENAYAQAARGEDSFSEEGRATKTLDDYAIIARFTTRSGGGHQRKEVYIAGVHQYGTWIAGEYIKRILYGNQNDQHQMMRSYILGDDDFIAVIHGDFDIISLTALHPEVFNGMLWRLLEGRWVRAEAWEARLQ